MKNYRSRNIQVKYYKGDDNLPSRILNFNVSEKTIKAFLLSSNDERNIMQFCNTYDGEDAEALYQFAKKYSAIQYEQIKYDTKFLAAYEQFKKNLGESVTGSHAEINQMRETYYWNFYIN